MFGFSGWKSGSDSSGVGGGGAGAHHKSRNESDISSQEMAGMSDDELADMLLTRFPAYGSSSSSTVSSSSSTPSSSVGTTSISNKSNHHHISNHNNNVHVQMMMMIPENNSNNNMSETSTTAALSSSVTTASRSRYGGGDISAAASFVSNNNNNSTFTNHHKSTSNSRSGTAATCTANHPTSSAKGGSSTTRSSSSSTPEEKKESYWDQDEQELWQRTITSIELLATSTTTNSHNNNSTTIPTMPGRHPGGKEQGGRPNSPTEMDDDFQLPRRAWVRGVSVGIVANERRHDDGTLLPHMANSANNNNPSSTPTKSSRSYFSRPFSSTSNYSRATSQQQQQYWMPDQLCKHCYSCETPFTVFRRRHHCRICGQVFCNTCSAYFLPNSSTTTTTTSTNNNSSTSSSMAASATTMNVRVCQMCYDNVQQQRQQQQQGASAEMKKKNPIVLPSHTTTKDGPNSDTNVTVEHHHQQPQQQQQVLVDDNDGGSIEIFETPLVNRELRNSRPGSHWAKHHQQQQTPRDGDSNDDALQLQPARLDLQLLEHGGGGGCGGGSHDDCGTTKATAVHRHHDDGNNNNNNNSRVSPSKSKMKRHTSAESSDSMSWLSLNNSATYASAAPSKNNINHNSSTNSLGISVSSLDTATGGGVVDSAVAVASRRVGRTAAAHLEALAEELLRVHAPMLYKDLTTTTPAGPEIVDSTIAETATATTLQESKDEWIHRLLTLATRCCATVEPNVKKGDMLDIRPYCKIKAISGGSCSDSAYISGVMFRKSVSHKKMAKVLTNPRIMLLSGGIEFTRSEVHNKIASLDTLVEQEEKYTEILVGKILKVKPDILMVGRSVSRIAQELFLKHGIALLQHVKASLLSRIARQTGATVISTTDHVMNQFGAPALGTCRRFRLITFRDNEKWVDRSNDEEKIDNNADGDEKQQRARSKSPDGTRRAAARSVRDVLDDPEVSMHERQAALAASQLGEEALDGVKAVTSGLCKRGVTQTFVMLEGCPKHLGCTVVLRGACKAALKEVKFVLRFLINAAYNLRLETSYLKERCATIREGFEVRKEHTYSSSLCVDYGKPEGNRKVRPWNGGNTTDSPAGSKKGQISAFDHQSILVTSIWMTEKPSVQCCPAEVKGICYYDSLQDVALGQFLRDSCFTLSLKCQNTSCKRSVLDHSLSFVHNDGLISIMVEEMEEFLPPPPIDPTKKDNKDDDNELDPDEDLDDAIATWTYCMNCKKVVTPLVFISDHTWKFSFGKFLEVFFYNRDAVLNAPRHGCTCNLQSAAALYFGCGKLAARFTYQRVKPYNTFIRPSLPVDAQFHQKEAVRRMDLVARESSFLFVKFDKHIDKVAREARSLFNSAINRPEHLQTVLSELNSIASEVDHVAKTLEAKIASVADECRREGAMNETLFRFPWFARRYLFTLMSAWNEKLSTTGQAISAMRKLAASMSGRQDNGIGNNVSSVVGEQHNEELTQSMKHLRELNSHYAGYTVTDITQALPVLPGDNDGMPDVDDEDEFDDSEIAVDVDADVLASRRRFNAMRQAPSIDSDRSGNIQPTKSLGTRRTGESEARDSVGAPPKAAQGGVRSALTRFFNRGGRESDQYTVDLGIFQQGRPRLAPGEDGVVVPVIDDQWSTIIAYSLASTEYARQFKAFSKMDPSAFNEEKANDRSYEERASTANPQDAKKAVEQQMLARNKSHIKHTFKDYDGEKGQGSCKFVCTSYWATQFHAVRHVFLSDKGAASPLQNSGILSLDQSYVESLSSAAAWAASGGKSGASFARTSDDRFVIKCISRTELQMFLDCAPAYFEYLSKAFFHGLPTVLCKIVGVYQIGVHNRATGKRSMEQVAVMQNIFYNRKISKIFDLKGSLRGRFAAQKAKDDAEQEKQQQSTDSGKSRVKDEAKAEPPSTTRKKAGSASPGTLLDGDFLEFTSGRPMPMTHRAKSVFQMSILNDTLFLSIINVLDYSILVGVDEEKMELVVGIIDFMRQYDILKQMERVGKSLPMVVGSEAPTIIQPPLYKDRFTDAMERYFMTVPSKWTTM